MARQDRDRQRTRKGKNASQLGVSRARGSPQDRARTVSDGRPSGRTGEMGSPARPGGGAATRTGHAAATRRRTAQRSASQTAWEWLRTLLAAFAIYFVVQAFVLQAFRIPSGSMENTLLVGDWLFVNKALYGPKVPFTSLHLPSLSEPTRDGIVVFESPIEPGLNLVKRVIGIGGDTLAMREGRLVRNGESPDEPYVRHTNAEGDAADPGMAWQLRHLAPGAIDPATYRPTRDDWGPVIVPPGHFFMMGDNRDASFDSRYYGFVRRDLIKGKPLFIYYSYDAKSAGPLPFLTAIRWNRIGKSIR
jgi:signal peptidase I